MQKIVWTCALGLLCLLAGCFGSTPKPAETKAKEIPTSVGKTSELTEDELIFRAKRYYEVGLYTESRENFEALRATYPLGAYGEFAEIKAADALFDTGSFADAAKAYDELGRNRPVSEALPYILFRAGRSYQLAQRGIGRDMTSLDKAQEKYAELLRRFPDSRHSSAAKELLVALMRDKATYAASIRDFYEHQGKKQAADKRRAQIDANITPALEAAVIATQNQKISATRTAELTALRLEAEAKMLKSPLTTPSRNSSKAGPNNLVIAQNSSEPRTTFRIVKAACRVVEGTIQAAIFLNKEITDRAWLKSVSDKAQWRIADASADADVLRTMCAGSAAVLQIGATGSVALTGFNTNEKVLTTTLPNPARLLIVAAVQ